MIGTVYFGLEMHDMQSSFDRHMLKTFKKLSRTTRGININQLKIMREKKGLKAK